MTAPPPPAGDAGMRRMPGVRSTALVAGAFGVAMGYLEAAVVVYLRAAIEGGVIDPAAPPATIGTYEVVEIVREIATIVMIATAGWLAGSSGLERLAWAAFIFGLWDIVYYAGLRLIAGWPPALDTWDVLFLIPSPWVGPVWAPIGVSLALVACGLLAAARLRRGRPIVIRPTHAVLALAGGGLVVWSFLIDTDRVFAGDSSPWTGWPVYLLGMALAALGTAAALAADRRTEAS